MNILYKIIRFYTFYKTRYKWRKKNRHNFTQCANLINDSPFPLEKVVVGKYTYGSLRVIPYSKYDGKLQIGNFCSIASDVCFLLGGEHSCSHISTYPFKAIFLKEDEATSKGNIIVEDDVWIGHSALILSGVTLSRGTIVAAGSVVTKSTEPYSIIGGNPARLIRKRFTDSTINKLLKIPFETWNIQYIINNIPSIYKELK